MKQLKWTKDNFEVSTDHTRLPVEKISKAFASDDLHWAVPLPPDVMREILQTSLCFGVYQHPPPDSQSSNATEPELIGFARCITDFVTFLYLTDVYVWPEHQGKGVGTWLIRCVQEVADSMPYLRKCMALTSNWEQSVPFYDRLMGMRVVGGSREFGYAVLSANGKGAVNSVMPR